MKSILIASCFIVGLTTIACWSNVYTHHTGREQFDRLERSLIGLVHADAKLNEEALKLRFEKIDYDRLTVVEDEFAAAIADVDRSAAYAFRPAASGRDRDSLIAPIAAKSHAVADLKAYHTVLHNSVAGLQRADEELRALSATQPELQALRVPLLELQQAAYGFALFDNQVDAEQFAKAVDRAVAPALTAESPAAKPRATFISNARKIMETRPRMERVLRDFDLQSTTANAATMLDNGRIALAAVETSANRFQRVSLASSFLLIGYIGYLLRRLVTHRQAARRLKAEQKKRRLALTNGHLPGVQDDSRRLMSALVSGLVRLNREGVVQVWSEAAERLFNISKDQALGQAFLQLPIQWKDSSALARLLTQEAALPESHVEQHVLFDDEQLMVLDIAVYPVRDKEQRVGTILLATNIGEARLFGQQFQQAQKLESVGQMAAGVAQEMNGPVQGIGDNVQFLKSSLSRLQPTLDLLCRRSEGDDVDGGIEQQIYETLHGLNLRKLLKHLPKAIEDAEQRVNQVSQMVNAMKDLSVAQSESSAAAVAAMDRTR